MLGASACRETGDALRYLSYFTDTYIAEQFANGALSDESLLRFGETSSASEHRVVAIQSICRTTDGNASAIVLTTTSSEATLLVEEFVFVDSGGYWIIDQVQRLAQVPVDSLTVSSSLATPSSPPTEPAWTPTIAATPEPVELSAPGIAWSTNEITIAQGGTIKLINDGSGGQHNFIIEGYNDDAPVDMPAGSQTDWTVPSDFAPGTYTFYCAVPGHRALMEGMIAILGGQTRAVRPSMVYPAPTMNVMATPRDSARRNGRGSVLRLREILRSWTVNRDLRAAGSPPVVGNGPVPPTSPMPDAGGHTRCAWPRYRPLDDGRAQSPPLRALRRAADHKSTHDEPLAGGGLVGWGGCFFGVEAFGDP